MRVRADLHIHSRYSRATSAKLIPVYLDRWARIKGLDLLGTGDCVHPLWLKELREQLEDAEEGCYTLKKSLRDAFNAGPALAEGLPEPGKAVSSPPRFVLSGEISTIYKDGGKTRKVHHLILLPDFKAAGALQTRLEQVGNIASDGRPILGMSSRDLLALLLDTDDRSLLIPAHIWTPWFSALGANSGYDSIDECYGDLASRIPAIETGLSSNPPMNWAAPFLDRFAVISNSDAHSPEKLGREATVFAMERSFSSLAAALWSRISASEGIGASGGIGASSESGIVETIEFYPQEGKYHYDGHRNCGVYRCPAETDASGGICPVCGKPFTRGVMGRVLELARRPVDETAPYTDTDANTNRRPYRSLVPLREILGELLNTGPSSKKVQAAYNALIEQAGDELSILMDSHDLGSIRGPGLSGEFLDTLSAALERMRGGEVSITPGYDGAYGVIRVAGGVQAKKGRGLFGELPIPASSGSADSRRSADSSGSAGASVPSGAVKGGASKGGACGTRCINTGDTGSITAGSTMTLDAAQEAAVSFDGPEALILAGPGTGKTAVLTARIARLLREGKDPASILAITFTVKAATELRERMSAGGAAGITAGITTGITAATFHSFCAEILRGTLPALPAERRPAHWDNGFRVLDEAEREQILEAILAASSRKRVPGIRRLGAYIETRKRFLLLPGETHPPALTNEPALARLAEEMRPDMDPELEELYKAYRDHLRASALLDFEDLLAGTVRLLTLNAPLLAGYRSRFRHILVDEYQDVNFAQYALIRLLAPGSTAQKTWNGGELRVIGDPNQAIYSFRGSDKRFIDRFIEDYPQAARFELTKSFRCAPPILKAAGELAGVKLQSAGGGTTDGGTLIFRSPYATEKSEAEGIARRLAALIGGTSFFAIDSGVAGDAAAGVIESGGGTDPSACAILLRTAALAPPIIKALKDHGIPYEFTGEEPWWKAESAGAVIALLRERFFPVPGTNAAQPVNAAQAVEAAWEYLSAAGLQSGGSHQTDSSMDRLRTLAALYDDPRTLLDILAVSGEAENRCFPTRREGARLMTIHASKGLEFDHVFIPALEEGILPFTLFEGSPVPDALLQEEKRLLYVAMTRARRGLYLSWAASRNSKGRRIKAEPSRFLKNLEVLIPLAETRPFSRQNPQPVLF
ncbi:MAG: UvrD-helicase domain-containing protein [Treponema sp.]|jgi:superfamily I DNA/RNA helicase/PHP family Zn ribbon phosphoesterase|nr:UvrD-helicase domain-containing protein [Treponema sp.]